MPYTSLRYPGVVSESLIMGGSMILSEKGRRWKIVTGEAKVYPVDIGARIPR